MAIALHGSWVHGQTPDPAAVRFALTTKITNNYEAATMRMTLALAHAVSSEKTDDMMRLLTRKLSPGRTNEADWRGIRHTVSREILTNLTRLEIGTKECSLVTNISVMPPPGKFNEFMRLQYSSPNGGVTNIEDPELKAFIQARSAHSKLWNTYQSQEVKYRSHSERSLKSVATAYSEPLATDAEIRELIEGFGGFDCIAELLKLLPPRSF